MIDWAAASVLIGVFAFLLSVITSIFSTNSANKRLSETMDNISKAVKDISETAKDIKTSLKINQVTDKEHFKTTEKNHGLIRDMTYTLKDINDGNDVLSKQTGKILSLLNVIRGGSNGHI